MNWENISITDAVKQSEVQNVQINPRIQMEEEQNENEVIQLKKFQDPTENTERKAYITLLEHFGDLLSTNNFDHIFTDLLTENSEFFLFNSTGRTPARYCIQPKNLRDLYKGMKICERIVRETYIELDKGTAAQLCNFKILYEGEENPVDEVVVEIFSIKNNKIKKYRSFSAKIPPSHRDSDPFEITSKDKALAVVTRVNYALAGQPNFEKVATLLHENVKYKIWSWDSQKCYELEKHNFVENFQQNMQENFVIKSIVPYEVYTEAKVAVGTYVYHLEGITGDYANKKYVWLTTCFYKLDDDYKIIRVSQQGELHLEGQVKPQFEVYPREKLVQKAQSLFTHGPTLELFYGDVFALNCITYTFGPEGAPTDHLGFCKGTAVVDRTKEWRKSTQTLPLKSFIVREVRFAESLVDHSDSSYDIAIIIYRFLKVLDDPEQKINDYKEMGTISVSLLKFEHGKIIKAYGFLTEVPDPIPSPFDDPSLESVIFRPKSTFL